MISFGRFLFFVLGSSNRRKEIEDLKSSADDDWPMGGLSLFFFCYLFIFCFPIGPPFGFYPHFTFPFFEGIFFFFLFFSFFFLGFSRNENCPTLYCLAKSHRDGSMSLWIFSFADKLYFFVALGLG